MAFDDYKNIGLGFGMAPGGTAGQLGVGEGMGRSLISAQGGNNFGFNANIDTNVFGGAPGATPPPNLGWSGMDMKTKFGAGLGIAQTGLNAYLGYQGHKMAKDQYREQKRQFNTNLGMQKSVMGGTLSDQYNTASNPQMLAASEQEYLAKYGL